MTNWDDFDKEPTDDDDDLSWLDDDNLFEESDKDKGTKQGNKTGVTGELPWMRRNNDESVSDDDELGWLDEEESVASIESDDDLNWGAVDTGEHDDLSWLTGDDEKPSEWQTPHPEVVNDEFERQMEAAEAADFGDTDSDLDWLTPDEPAAQPASDSLDLPDWMADMELPDVSDDDLAAAHASVDDDIDADEGGWGLSDDDDQYAAEEEPEVSFTSMFGGSDDDEDEDEGVSFDSILAGTSDDEDEGDLGFLGSLSGADDDDELASIPTGADTSPAEDDFWGEIGSTGFTQEMASVESEPEPVNTGWGMDSDEADEGISFDSILAGTADDDGDLGFLSSLSDDDEEQADTDFAAMFARDDEEPELQFEAVSDAPDDEFDDLLAELDTGADADVDDLLATLDIGASEEVSMDDLLAELEGVDSGDSGDLDDLLAGLGDDEDEFADMPLAFDEGGVSEMLDSVSGDELDFLVGIESETESEEFDDAVDPLAFSSGITDLLENASEEELELLSEMEDELDADAEYEDDLDPLAFDSGITEMFAALEGDELGFLTEMEEQLEDADAEYDEIEPLAFDAGITDLMKNISTSDLDLLGQMESELEANAEPADELDFLASLDADETPEAADVLDFDFDFDDEQPEPVANQDDELDFLASLDADETPEAADALDFDFDFGDEEAEPVASSDDIEFDFSFGGAVEEVPIPPPAAKKPDSGLLSRSDDLDDDFGFSDTADWLSALDDAIEDEPEPASDNVDSLLSSIGEVEDLPDDNSDAVPMDLDDIFDEYGMDEEYEDDEDFALEDAAEAGEIPEWLREAASGEADKYEASKVIRDLKDRSLDDLDDRLQDLHERGLELKTDESETEADRQRLNKLVPNIGEALIPTKVAISESAFVSIEPKLTPEQLKRAELLRSIVGEVVVGETETSVRTTPRRRRLRLPIGRWLIALLLAAVVIAPFYVSDLHISDTPPVVFEGDSPAFGAYEVLDSIQPYEPVLFAVEYGAVGAMELDLMTETLLTHILHQGGLPVIVSSDPVGALRAEAIAARLAGTEGYNTEYYVAGFLPAGSLGLRDLTENLSSVIDNNSNGQTTNLDVRSLDDFKVIVFITDGGETVRNWMEQVVPQTNAPIIIGMGQSARPVAQPYVATYLGNKVRAVLVGYPDAVTYQNMLVADYGLGAAAVEETETVEPEVTDEATATPEPTDVPPTNTPEPTVEATDGAVVPVLDQTEEATEAEEDEATVAPTLAATETEDEPTATREPTDRPATNTPEPSPTEAPVEEEMVEIAIVIADGRVNVREGAGAGFNVVSTVGPGDRLRIIGRNDAEDWLQIVLADGREAWIAAFLVNTEFIPESEAESLYDWGKVRYYRPPVQDSIEQVDTATPSPTPEPIVRVGSNISGTTIDVFANADLQGTPIEDLPNGTEFVVLEQTDTASNILMVDGRTGWVESRFVRIVELPLSESGFAATDTPTPTPTLTPTLTPTSTSSPTPTATPFTPDVFPQPLTDVEARWNAMTLGLLTTILMIFAGNVYWITRWLRQRGQ